MFNILPFGEKKKNFFFPKISKKKSQSLYFFQNLQISQKLAAS